ncbi:ADOP family duplicated permease [Paludibaculum fermentans]|uniref:ADOP family duplicated permease n=1 Tax=Paludibaculum fermentans TaxID=1473598 RepID=UPI003EB6EFAC
MRRFFLKLLRRRTLHQDLEAELAFHREMSQVHANPIPLGRIETIQEQALDQWRFTFFENLGRDLVYALRGLRRSPGFVCSALLSLALGIGVNTAIFSLAVEFLFSEPSVTDARSLVSIRLGGNSHADRQTLEYLQNSGLFQAVAGENEETFINWNDGTETHRLFAVLTSRNYFTALGVPMAMGRGWNETDPPGVTVLRYDFWRSRFHSDPSILGRTINLEGQSYTVVGILPENHRTLLGFGFAPDVYLPATRPDVVLAAYGRLKPGMSLGEARAGLDALSVRMDSAVPHPFPFAHIAEAAPIAGFARLQEERQLQTIGLFFAMLLVVVGLVLLIACVNVASLLLARASARRQEIGIRLALGASRSRLLQQLLAESLVLSTLGALLGLLLAQVTASLLARIQLPLPLPIRLQIEPDWRVAFYSLALGAVATVVCGLLPAWQSVRDSIASDVRRERRLHLRRLLVAAQVAISVVVLSTGFLFLRNLLRSTAISPGFDLRQTLRADVFLPPDAYETTERKALYIQRALSELESIPGIEAVGAARIVPFTDMSRMGTEISVTGTGEKKHISFHWNAVSPGYFRAMGIPVLQGRTFADADRTGEKVVIVNKTFAERYFPGSGAVGTAFLWHDGKAQYRIVGVVGDTKNITIGEEPAPQLYEALSQSTNPRPRLQFVLRSSTPPATRLAPVRDILHRLEPSSGIEVATLYSSIGLAFLPSQVGAGLLGAVGLLGLLLAAVGLYGVMSFTVARRTREIGIRIAIGANPRAISGMLLSDSIKLIAWGSAAGLAVALFVTKPLSMFLVPGLHPNDPLTYLAVVLVLTLTGFLATLEPVRRALNIDPATSLRYE